MSDKQQQEPDQIRQERDEYRAALFLMDEALIPVRSALLGRGEPWVSVIQAHETISAVLSECEGVAMADDRVQCGGCDEEGRVIRCWPCEARAVAMEEHGAAALLAGGGAGEEGERACQSSAKGGV